MAELNTGDDEAKMVGKVKIKFKSRFDRYG
jgi:hypothetical protein